MSRSYRIPENQSRHEILSQNLLKRVVNTVYFEISGDGVGKFINLSSVP